VRSDSRAAATFTVQSGRDGVWQARRRIHRSCLHGSARRAGSPLITKGARRGKPSPFQFCPTIIISAQQNQIKGESLGKALPRRIVVGLWCDAGGDVAPAALAFGVDGGDSEKVARAALEFVRRDL
jgi:hypothetical protein